LSVDAVHDNVAEPIPPCPNSAVGEVGGWLSEPGASKCTNDATDGTPAPFKRNSM
jgi:hypothetical protein